MPAGMGWAGDGLAQGTTNTVTVLLVAYSPRALAAGLTNAELDTAAMPSAPGHTRDCHLNKGVHVTYDGDLRLLIADARGLVAKIRAALS